MKRFLNTFYVLSEDIYLSLEGENVVAMRDKQEVARYPLHTLQGIVSFSYAGASPALMGACAKRGVGFALCTPNGRFLARVSGEISGNVLLQACCTGRRVFRPVSGEISGNVLLRRTQYRTADDMHASCKIARTMIFAKLYNSRWSIERTRRDHGMRVDDTKLAEASQSIKALLPQAISAENMESLRGIEGNGANTYFGAFDEMILNAKDVFYFNSRSRRPPLDRVNAMLSFAYSLLAHDCASALESSGLDPYVGFLHRDRPGRESLALDLMEELRPCMADRFVLKLINNRMVKKTDFVMQDSGAVLLTDEGRRSFIKTWQDKKREELKHPYLGEKLKWGLIPYIQAQLLGRYLRGDLDDYPPFLWK